MAESKEKKGIRIFWRVFWTVACLLWLGFIFGNSLKTGTQSSAQSAGIVKWVQKVVGYFAPNSSIANATGADYERLHAHIRQIAHFTEFAVLGGLTCLCYFSYTKKAVFLYLPLLFLCFAPVFDEFLQTLTEARAGGIEDVLTDGAGALSGFILGGLWLLLCNGIRRLRKRRKKRARGRVSKAYAGARK